MTPHEASASLRGLGHSLQLANEKHARGRLRAGRTPFTLLMMTYLPSGAVTFFFSDIQGSTRLVKQLRADYGAVLQEHQRLLRAAFEAYGGYEVDTQGDSFFVAFSSARDALLAAVEGQRALLDHPWPDGVQIKVRIGLHTGQAVTSDGRYTGLAVNRAARIGAAGHGGQILVSQATQTLLEDEEEDLDFGFRDLGEQRLKDLDRPVRLYQVTADGLPAEFPPLRPGAEPPAVAPVVPGWRRPAVIVTAAVALAALIAVLAAALALRDGAASVIPPPNSLAVIDPDSSRIVDAVTVGTRPGPVSFGAGSVWVGNLDDRSVTRVDAESRTVLRHISLDRRTPTGLAFGFGELWVAHGLRGDLSRIDPQFNEVAAPVDIGGTAFGSPNGSVAVGPDAVWAVFGDSTFARIEPSTARVAESTRAGAFPAGVVVGSGSVWVSNSGDANVTRYNPASFTEDPLDSYSVGRRPTGIAAGEAIWVANTADNSVSRIDPTTGSVVPVAVGEAPTAVTVTEDAVWVVNSADGTISRIDLESNEVVRTIEIGNSPSGIMSAEGFLWVTVQAP
jgi:class 3 adenylate cyclase/DNA-binding beta-propeller fold protein YncE